MPADKAVTFQSVDALKSHYANLGAERHGVVSLIQPL